MKELRRQDRMVLELPKLLPGLAFLLKGILCLNPQKQVGGTLRDNVLFHDFLAFIPFIQEKARKKTRHIREKASVGGAIQYAKPRVVFLSIRVYMLICDLLVFLSK